jgi:endo-1,4-beta-xylanase
MKPLALLPMGLAFLAACGSDGTVTGPGNGNPLDTVPALRELAVSHGLGIGAAAGGVFFGAGVSGETYRQLLADQFNVLTAENDMKHASIHPGPDTYAFDRADALVAFAESNGMAVRGHTLVWHNQLADWLTAGTWTPAEVDSLLGAHIAEVAGRYEGRIAAWDVVNEAVADDGSLRATFWSDHLGDAYLETAFRAAREADPAAALFYNDYGIAWLNQKADSVYALLQRLLDHGVPVDGIGFQGHFVVGGLPSRADLTANFQRFADLGLQVHVTELDVRIPLPASSADLQQQAADFARVVEACLAVDGCDAVVTWGLGDANSWVPGTFEGYGAPLLFNGDYQPKPAYWRVHEALGG